MSLDLRVMSVELTLKKKKKPSHKFPFMYHRFGLGFQGTEAYAYLYTACGFLFPENVNGLCVYCSLPTQKVTVELVSEQNSKSPPGGFPGCPALLPPPAPGTSCPSLGPLRLCILAHLIAFASPKPQCGFSRIEFKSTIGQAEFQEPGWKRCDF